MSQDQSSGAVANRWGKEMARKLAISLGAKFLASNSNEATWNNHRVVIKTAAINTTSVGVTYQMLERLDFVIAAFQISDTLFQLYSLSTSDFKNSMRETRSKGASAGKVGIVSRSVFLDKGKTIGQIDVS